MDKGKIVIKEKKPLGIQLNNPLNIRVSNSRWEGARYPGRRGFVEFLDVAWGWRAAIVIMAKTYYKRGWNTPRLIIEHWAPYTENDTDNYVGFVCKYSGLTKDMVMPPIEKAPVAWYNLLKAMAKMEVGIRWVDDEMLAKLDLAILMYLDKTICGSIFNIE